MTQEKAYQMAYDMGGHPYSVSSMAEALLRGVEIGKEEQKDIDKELIDMLIDELYMSRAYHLGITGLDSAAERAMKEKDGDCALIRGIDRTIKYVKEAMGRYEDKDN